MIVSNKLINQLEVIHNNIFLPKNYFFLYLQDELERMKDPETQTLNFEGVDDLLRDQYPSIILFSSVRTKTSVNKFLIEKLKMVPAEKKCISKSLVWKKKKGSLNRQADLREVDHGAYIVPFIDNLKNLMMNDNVRENVNNPMVHTNGVYRTILDGKFYRENDFFL